jgi:carboxyl-terminal processing protease
MLRSYFNFIWIIVIVFSLGLRGLHAESDQKPDPDTYYQNFEELINVIKEIQNKYVNEVELEKLLKNAYEGMLAGLDPYSQFIDSENLQELRIETEGEFDGLGIEVIIKNGVLTVLTPIVDSPAFRAGVLIGDRIIKIDGKSTRNISIREAVKLLRGEPNTKITLTVIHEEESEPVDITINRAKIHVKSVRGARIVDEEGKIGYIAVTSFQENTIPDMESAIEDLRKQGMTSLVLDLRFNPGGLLNVARDMSDKFIKKGLIVTTKGRHKSQDHKYKAHRSGTYPDFPLIILINKGSASASEIVAGSIKDHKRGILLGTKTFGKGSVQSLIPIENRNSALKLTTAKYYTPSGTQIDGSGIEPDIKVDLTKAELKELHTHLSRSHATDILTENGDKVSGGENKTGFVDAQLARAIDILKGISVYAKITGEEG